MDVNDQSPQVRGVTSNFDSSSKFWRNLLLARNALALLVLFLLAAAALDALPTSGRLLTGAIVTAVGGYALWRAERVRRRQTSDRTIQLGAVAGLLLAFIALGYGLILQHPLWRAAEPLRLDGWAPSASEQNWRATGFFYTVGFWPESVGGQAVLPSIPYQKGPPQQFLGRITLRWNWPEVRVHVDGPKTPDALGRGKLERADARECFLKGFVSLVFSPSCQSLRADAWRKLDLPERASRLRWLDVDQPRLTEVERPQGLWFESEAADGSVLRQAVLVNAKGAFQKFTLQIAAAREPARRVSDIEAFTQVIRSQRVASELGITRTIADHDLQSVKLGGGPAGMPIEEAARAQILLASKLSAQPDAAEAYFHLAGSAWLASQAAGSPPELSSWAKAQVTSALSFLRDVAPSSPRVAEVESLAAQMRGI